MKYTLTKNIQKLIISNLIFLVMAVVLMSSLMVLSTSRASSLSGSQFKAGRIIDDTVFYKSKDLSTTQIRQFLDSKVPDCDVNGTKMYNSTQTRAQWAAVNGKPAPPYTCLKDYDKNIKTKIDNGGSDLCTGDISTGIKDAAQIISAVAIACDVNPKVLLVLLQKEQSLITDDWPWLVQYTKATGYGCPDSNLPRSVDANNNNCYDEYEGFFMQVYKAAEGYKRYRANPTNYNYRAGRNNTILWNPNSACGSSTVYIENQATAGLYIYTPYRPNQAALDNLYGTGNSCSSYGNRNFWRMFNDWFGSTHTTTEYRWEYVSQQSFTDSSRTQPFTSTTTVQPGQKVYVRMKALNTGNKTWSSSDVRVGTERKRDRISAFQDSSWLSATRPAALIETSVVPGLEGTFEFVLEAPNEPGSYNEHFNLMVENKEWMKDVGQYFKINVVEAVAPSSSVNSSLSSGDQLNKDDFLLSPDLNSTLALEDGSIVLKTNFKKTWMKGSVGADKLIMQTDGNLVLRNSANQALWNSGTVGNPGAYFELQSDGNLVIKDADDDIIWTSEDTTHYLTLLAYVNPSIENDTLLPGQNLSTYDRDYRLTMQTDGNLVLRNASNKAIWMSRTTNYPGAYLTVQSDGNAVIRNSLGKAIWNTGTRSSGGSSTLTIQDDSNLVLRNKSNKAIWNSGVNE